MVDLLALVCVVYCNFVTFPFGVLGQVWYLIVLITDPYCLSCFVSIKSLFIIAIRPFNYYTCLTSVSGSMIA